MSGRKHEDWIGSLMENFSVGKQLKWDLAFINRDSAGFKHSLWFLFGGSSEQHSPLHGTKQGWLQGYVVMLVCLHHPAKHRHRDTQASSSTKCEGFPVQHSSWKGAAFLGNMLLLHQSQQLQRSASFRHTSSGSSRSALVHVPEMNRVDVSMPFPASKISRLLKKS